MSVFTTEADEVLEKIVKIAKDDVAKLSNGDENTLPRASVMSLCDWGSLMATVSKHQRAAGVKDAAGASLDDLKGDMLGNPLVAKVLGLPDGTTLGDLMDVWQRSRKP